jgi:peroxidase
MKTFVQWTRKLRERLGRQGRILRLNLETLEDRCQPSVIGYSLVDETNNNADGVSGTANTQLLRLSAVAYKDGFSTPGMGGGAPTFVAGSRLVSNSVSNQATTLFGSTDVNTVDQNGLSDFGYTWGQFLDHDMDLTPDGGAAFNIPADANHPAFIPGTDPIGSLLFTRSEFDPATGTALGNPREQVNVNTSFLDLSQVYGSTLDVSNALRTGSGGRLKSSPGADGIIDTADDLLPYNTTAALPYNNGNPYFTQAQLDAFHMANDAGLVASTELFVAGDRRANETIELASLQTLFMRNHNAIARQLQTAHPDWTDQQLFDEARKLNIAEEQIITYTAYLPALLGPNAVPAYTGYDPMVDPSIANEFSTIAFRFGHSLLNNTVARDANDGSSIGDVPLAQNFFDPRLLTPGGVTDPVTGFTSSDIGAVLKGDADNNAQAMDVMAVSSIRNLLFGQGGPGEDLIARDMWRAHDNGLGTYNQVRAAFGLPLITDTNITETDPTDGFSFTSHGFEQITSNVHVQRLLSDAYTNFSRNTTPGFLSTGHFAGDIDPFIAGLAEDHVPGSDLGPLFTTILVNQFTRLRSGDQYFYLNESFNAEEQAILDQGSTLGKVITANTGVTNLQSDVFRFLSKEDGKGKGYYTNKNGQAELTGSQTGTTLTTDLYNNLVAALANPDQPGSLVLVDANGNYLSAGFLQSYDNLRSYLQNSSGGSLAYKLSAQLLTAEINILLGKVDPTTSIYVPAVTMPGTTQTLSSTLQDSLMTNGVSNPSGIANVQAILNTAIAQLRSSTPDATLMEALKDCLDGINSNEQIFILK